MNEHEVKFIEIYERFLEMQKRSLQMQLNEIIRQLEAIKTIKGLPDNNTKEDSVK